MRAPAPAVRAGVAVLALAAPAEATAAPGPAFEEWMAAGDRAWEGRAVGSRGDHAPEEPIRDAVDAYSEALAARPGDREARWKLLRSLFYLGEYALRDDDERLAVFERGRALAEEGLDLLAEAAGGREAMDALAPDELVDVVDDRTEAATAYFWAAVHWGLWGRTRGKLPAARQGVAGIVRDYAQRVNALDGTIENGGGHRILGRLHTEAPRIPFVTGWIDRDTALAELERAHRTAPDDLLTRVYLAELIFEHFPERSPIGETLLRQVVASDPRPDYVVEERRAIARARELLAER